MWVLVYRELDIAFEIAERTDGEGEDELTVKSTSPTSSPDGRIVPVEIFKVRFLYVAGDYSYASTT